MSETTAAPTLDPLLGGDTVAAYRDAVLQGAERVAERLRAVDAPLTGVSPDALGPAVEEVDLDRPLADAEAALDEVDRLYLRDATFFHHPRYLGHLNCPVAIPALLAETILAPVNSSLDTWDQSAGATLIERRLIDWTAGRIGLGEDADGVFTSGGTQSNLQALFLARDEAAPDPADRAKLRILVSDAGHFSVRKAAGLLGLAEDAVVALSTDEERRMRPDALRHELERCAVDGTVPMAVVATAGTTDFGSIDPLEEIAEACAEHGVWLHVDAAYGCGLLVSRRRDLLRGIERADSVTADFHKAFFQPVAASAVLVRDRRTLRHATHHADYLNPEAATVPNQVDKSLQTTRRFDALKLWLTLRVMGPDGVGELFDRVIDRAAEGHELLREDPRFEVVTSPQLSTLVFRFRPTSEATPETCDRVNAAARDTLLASGAAFVASTVVHGRTFLKLTLLNPATTREDLQEVLELVAGHAEAAA
jgi:L-2,4-diaminobutyrate decarboxylase